MIVLNSIITLATYTGVVYMIDDITSMSVKELKTTSDDISTTTLVLHMSSSPKESLGVYESPRMYSNYPENTIIYPLTDYQIKEIIDLASKLGSIESTLNSIEKKIMQNDLRRKHRLDILESIMDK